MELPKGTKFVRGKGQHKYTAMVPVNGEIKIVHFGHKKYQQYKDSVPVSMGGGLWSHKNHGDETRRQSYRARHGGIKRKNGQKAINVKYTPGWFSYHFLW